MKKIRLFVSFIMILCTLTGCVDKQDTPKDMFVAPSEFSEETEKVLSIMDEEIMFFDYDLDETVKSMSIDIWEYEDGEWADIGGTYGNIEPNSKGQIALRITDSSYDIFNLKENGHSKSSYPEVTDFKKPIATGGTRLSSPTAIKLNHEIPVWVKIGTDKDTMAINDISEDFREYYCTAGVAFTVTFSDKDVD